MKYCWTCGAPFEPNSAMHRYCEEHSRSIKYRKGRGIKPGVRDRFCRQCGAKFTPTSANHQHCSADCSKQSARESRSKFYERNPEKMTEYRNRAMERIGPDGNLKRFYKFNPDAPKACEACGEQRVLDVAHKPGHERNGSWRSKSNTKWPEKVWVLCPTCHALLDRMGYDPAEIGLEGGDAQ